MTQINRNLVPPDATIYKGARGSEYILRNGNRVYLTDNLRRYKAIYKQKRGAFQRFLNNNQ